MRANKKQLVDIFGVTDRTITDWESAGLPIESRPVFFEKSVTGCSINEKNY